MPPEAIEEAHDWVIRAGRDLVMARRALAGDPALPDQAAFHAQQATEKSLKALLAYYDQAIAKTHNLPQLLASCLEIDPMIARFEGTAQQLNPYATQFRYPGGPLEPSIPDAAEAVRLAEELLDYVQQQIGRGTTGLG